MVAPKALNRVTSMQRWNVPKNDWQCCGESTTSPWRMAKNGNFWMVKNGSFTEFHMRKLGFMTLNVVLYGLRLVNSRD
jgi:hypothetical protein